jgi:hypothetical protein
LSARGRKITLVAHIAAAGSWIGIELVLGVLVITAMTAERSADVAALSVAIAAFANWPLVFVGAVTLVSGLLLGLGTKIGVLRYWWVVVKLALNVVLLTLVFVLLMPGVATLGSSASEALAGGTPVVFDGQLIFPPIVSSTALVFAMTLAVFRPWGRVKQAAA